MIDLSEVTSGRCEMSTCLDGYMRHQPCSDFGHYRITAAFKKPVFTTALSHNWEIAWKHKKVRQWSSEDVMAWFLYVIEDQEGKDIVESKLHNFNVKGVSLMCMTEYEFIARDPLYGQTLYRDLQKRLREEREAPRPWSTDSCVPHLLYSRYPDRSPSQDDERVLLPTTIHKQPDLPELPTNWDSMWKNTSIYEWSELHVMAWILHVLEDNSPIDEIDLTRFKCRGEDLLRMSREDFKERSPNYGQKLYEAWICKKYEDYSTRPVSVGPHTIRRDTGEDYQSGDENAHSDYFDYEQDSIFSPVPVPTCPTLSTSSPRSMEGSDSEDSDEDPLDTQSALPRKRAGGHGSLWPFLRDLLKSGKNSEVIDWLHREKGIFRVKETKRLAELWGERRNNPKMNYEKMSRSIRHNYRSGYLKKVPGRLVFGFGPFASGWKYYEVSSVVPEHGT